jgi:menaquinone-9 beta-reductase
LIRTGRCIPWPIADYYLLTPARKDGTVAIAPFPQRTLENGVVTQLAIKQEYDADVVIAGAGPAGAAAACYLARRGASVIALDRAKFPRDKVCGDCVGPLALVELDALGVSQIDGYSQTNIGRRGALYLDGEELISLLLLDIAGVPQHVRVIPRLTLDNFVADAARQAGARVMDGFTLTDFSLDDDAVVIEARGRSGSFTLRARLLIGADGSTSTVARIMRGSLPPRRDRMVAARAYFTNVIGPQDQLDLYISGGCFPGYYWLFPTGNREANVGLGVPLETLPAHELAPAAVLRRFLHDDPALAARLRKANLRGKIIGWPLMTYNHRLPIVADRLMLIGDAAGLINPLNGEGIQYALLSARWAAEIVAPHLRDGDFSAQALAPFATRVECELGYEMALAQLIVQFITNRALTPVWLQALKIVNARARRDADYARIAAGIFAGLIPARDALSFKVVVGTIDEAIRSLAAEALSTTVAGPREWARLGIDIAQVGFQLTSNAAANPSGFAEWMTGTMTYALELGSQAARDAIAGRPRTRT